MAKLADQTPIPDQAYIPAPRWVPVSESLPPVGRWVMALYRGQRPIAARLTQAGRWNGHYIDLGENLVTHWCDCPPLPAPELPQENRQP